MRKGCDPTIGLVLLVKDGVRLERFEVLRESMSSLILIFGKGRAVVRMFALAK